MFQRVVPWSTGVPEKVSEKLLQMLVPKTAPTLRSGDISRARYLVSKAREQRTQKFQPFMIHQSLLSPYSPQKR
jgi:hypothetical protein